MSQDNLEKLAEKLAADANYRVIRKLADVAAYNSPDPDLLATEGLRNGVFVDVETTGLDAGTDQVIELALQPFEFSGDGRIFALHEGYNALRDPGVPIPAQITRLTNITDAMVKDRKLDTAQIEVLLKPAHLIVAHNAAFDRPFAEQLHPLFESRAWACSMIEVPWRDEGLEGTKLDYLAYRYGFFYDAHRASGDCRAGIHLLAQTLPDSGRPALAVLLESARRKTMRVWALGSPFDSKDKLKLRQYRWNGGEDGRPKAWYRDLDEAQLNEEFSWLKTEVFAGHLPELPVDTINAFNRYSARA